MVNFGALDTVPERFRGRNLYVHNPQVTLMRTTPEENAAIGRWIGSRLDPMHGPVRFLLPEGGVSAIDAPVSRSTIRRRTRRCSARRGEPATTANAAAHRLPHQINESRIRGGLVQTSGLMREVARRN